MPLERKGERERKRNIDAREKHRLVALLYMPRPGIEPTTWVCALTRNLTLHYLVCGTILQPNEAHWLGQNCRISEIQQNEESINISYRFRNVERYTEGNGTKQSRGSYMRTDRNHKNGRRIIAQGKYIL